MTSTKLSAIQIEALRALEKGPADLTEVRGRIAAFGRLPRAGRERGATMETLYSLARRGFAQYSAGLGSMYSPETSVVFRITGTGSTLLEAMDKHRAK